ncbi:MAG: MBL fold metallo-hydrolase [bacterium]|nr:MBL fold metallo-hydrolase [bacterium]
MQVKTLVLRPMRTNCYLLKSGGEIGIVDPGGNEGEIIPEIKKLGGKVVWVLSTHGHFDHLLAAGKLAQIFKVPFYLHPEDEFLLKGAKQYARYYLNLEVEVVEVRISPLKAGMKISLGSDSLEVLAAPGHTPGGVCLYDPQNKLLFCGDLVFGRGVVGRTDFDYGSEEKLQDSLKKILALPGEIMIYSGHGRLVTLAELKNNLQVGI